MPLKWRHRRNSATLYWLANERKAKLGYKPSCVRLHDGFPISEKDMRTAQARAAALDADVKAWNPEPAPLLETKPRPSPPVFVYFIELNGHIKIGHTQSIEARIARLKTATPLEITLLGVIPGSAEIEKFIRWMFRSDHVQGEWYARSDDLLAFIARHTTRVVRKTRQRAERKPNWIGMPRERPREPKQKQCVAAP